jgi:hypothetical protein
MEDLRWGERLHRDADTKLLPPCMLRWTSGSLYSGQYGTDLIYDTNDRMSIARESMIQTLTACRNNYRVAFNQTCTR